MQHITPHVQSLLTYNDTVSKAYVIFTVGELPFQYVAYGVPDISDKVTYLKSVMVEATHWVNTVLAVHDVMIHLPEQIEEV